MIILVFENIFSSLDFVQAKAMIWAVGVKVQNMKMAFDTEGTWHWVGNEH